VRCLVESMNDPITERPVRKSVEALTQAVCLWTFPAVVVVCQTFFGTHRRVPVIVGLRNYVARSVGPYRIPASGNLDRYPTMRFASPSVLLLVCPVDMVMTAVQSRRPRKRPTALPDPITSEAAQRKRRQCYHQLSCHGRRCINT
jgi:hypothetical protein